MDMMEKCNLALEDAEYKPVTSKNTILENIRGILANAALSADVPEFCKSVSVYGEGGVKEKDFSLVPSKYIEFVNRDETVDYETKMKELQAELSEILRAEAETRADVLNVFKSLGYEIKL